MGNNDTDNILSLLDNYIKTYADDVARDVITFRKKIGGR